MSDETVLVRDDLSAVIVYTAASHYMDFHAYEQVGWTADRKPGELAGILFEKVGGRAMEMTTELSEAQTVVNGSIKWDGCSHYFVGEGANSGYVHLCGTADVRRFAALGEGWETVDEIYPH